MWVWRRSSLTTFTANEKHYWSFYLHHNPSISRSLSLILFVCLSLFSSPSMEVRLFLAIVSIRLCVLMANGLTELTEPKRRLDVWSELITSDQDFWRRFCRDIPGGRCNVHGFLGFFQPVRPTRFYFIENWPDISELIILLRHWFILKN